MRTKIYQSASLNRLTTNKVIRGGLFCIAALIGCFSAGCGGTNVGPGKTEIVVGALYYTDGKPADHATVTIAKTQKSFPSPNMTNNATATGLDTRIASDGKILLSDTLEDGYYCIFSKFKNLRAFSDSVLFTNGTCREFRDTLKDMGSITGQIKMKGLDDPRNVLILLSIPISDIDIKVGLVNRDGYFTLYNVPQGTFMVRFFPKDAYYQILDTMFTFTAGVDDTLSTPIELVYTKSMPVTGFRYTMDTLMRSVTIEWDSVADTLFGSFQMEWVSLSQNGFVMSNAFGPTTTQFTKYLEESPIMVRMQACYNVECSEATPWVKIQPVELCSSTTICQPVDSIQADDIAVSENMIYILGRNHYTDSVVFVKRFDHTGTPLGSVDLSSQIKRPQALALAGDTVIILDGKDTLCVHRLLNNYSTMCLVKIPVPQLDKNIQSLHRLEVDEGGGLFITSGITLYKVDSSGAIINVMDSLSPAFSVTKSGLFCTPIDSMYRLLWQDKQSFNNVAVVTFNDEKVVMQSDISVKALSVNNNGIACCLLSQSLYVFNTDIKRVVRLFVYGGNTVVGMRVTDNNQIFILYNNARIDRIDLNNITEILKN